ncbi:conserved hypothetical protein [Bradyrhizobium sp. STM 3809]|nr:conserved hypothetical protein [Bradyrhizobium sp. STM 3809]
MAHGAINVAGDAVHTAVGLGEAGLEAAGAIGHGALDMAGTIVGTAADVGADALDAAGAVVKGGFEAGVAVADGAIGVATDAASAAGHLIGGPIGEAVSGIAHGVDAVGTGVVNGVGHVVGEGVSGLAQAAGDLTGTIGHQLDAIGHDLGSLVNDLSHGNLGAAIGDIFKLAQDGLRGDGLAIAHGPSEAGGHGGFWDSIASAVSHAGENAQGVQGAEFGSGLGFGPLHGEGSSHNPIIVDSFGDHGHPGNTGIVPPNFDIGHAGGAHDAPHVDYSHIVQMDEGHHFAMHG